MKARAGSSERHICGRIQQKREAPTCVRLAQVSDGYHTVGAAAAAADQVEVDTLDITTTTTRTAERLCEPGFWCEGGFRYPCEAGSFGDEFGATLGSCSGTCSGGFLCGSGSVSAEERPCGVSKCRP